MACMDEVMTLEEIEAAYPDEWVLLSDLYPEDPTDLLGGRVLFHSERRDDVFERDKELRLPSAAILFMGPPLAPGVDGALL